MSAGYVDIEFLVLQKYVLFLFVIWIINQEVKCDPVKLHCDLQLVDGVYGLQGSSKGCVLFSWTERLVSVFYKMIADKLDVGVIQAE